MRAGLRRVLGFGSGRRRAASTTRPPTRSIQQANRGPACRSDSEMGAVAARLAESAPTTYWCSAIAYPRGAGRSALFGAHVTHDARRSVRWLQMRVSQLADQLDLKQAQPTRAWVDDLDAAATAMGALLNGESYSLTVCDDQATYVLTAQFSTGAEPIIPGRGVAWPI